MNVNPLSATDTLVTLIELEAKFLGLLNVGSPCSILDSFSLSKTSRGMITSPLISKGELSVVLRSIVVGIPWITLRTSVGIGSPLVHYEIGRASCRERV